MNGKKIILPLILLILTAAAGAPAAAEEKYHPGDVAVINQLLKNNDAGNRVLARAGWEIDRPETWRLLPPAPNRVHRGPSWKDGRLTNLILYDCELSGALDLSGLDRLAHLDLQSNYLTALTGLKALTDLRELSLKGNRLAVLSDLSGLERLETLSLGDNRLTRLSDLSRLEKLLYLDLAANPFENLRLLDALNWSNLKAFSYSLDQIPHFSLAGKKPESFLLNVWSAPENYADLTGKGPAGAATVDLAGWPLNRLILNGRVTADQFLNPGPVRSVFIAGDHHYYMAELRALAVKFDVGRFQSPFPQTAPLDDAAGDLKSEVAYSPAELSPRLAVELAAAGPGARLLAVARPSEFLPLAFDAKGQIQSQDFSFINGQATFRSPGLYYLAVTTAAQMDPSRPYLVVGYLDVFTVR